MKKSKWFLGILLFGLTFIIGTAIYLITYYGLQFSINDIKDFLGILISCTSMLITAYFVVMAVNAYGHVKEIEKTKDEIEKTKDEIEKTKDGIERQAKVMDDICQKLEKRAKKVMFSNNLEEFRDSYISDLLDEDTRYSFILNIANLGDESDICPLEKINLDPNESPRIREIAKIALEEIKNRLNIQTKTEEIQKKSHSWLNKLFNI